MRNELNEPLGPRAKPAPLAVRWRPLAVWGGRVAVAALALGAGALYWRAATPRAAEVALIPFDAIKTVVPTATPTPSATFGVFPPAANGGETSSARKSGYSAPNGHSPQIIEVGEALGRQPGPAVDQRLTENSKYGLLPRIAADGARPAAVYARPFADTPGTRGAPRIAVFVGGLGLDPQTTEAAISRLPSAVSLGLAPYGPDLAKVAARARSQGHEIWLQAPMQGVGADPGPHTLKSDADAAQNQDSLRWLMARFTGYVGVDNYLGAKLTADPEAVSPILAEIARRGLLYLDDGRSALSTVEDLAPGLDLKAARADVIAVGDAKAIDDALAEAEDIARRRGSAILVASALPATLDRLAPWAAGLERKGFAFAPVSALTAARPDRDARANP